MGGRLKPWMLMLCFVTLACIYKVLIFAVFTNPSVERISKPSQPVLLTNVLHSAVERHICLVTAAS